jgi:hypothetical protein
MESQRTSSAQPAPPAGRDRQQLARRLLREASLELARLRRTRGAYRRTWRRISRAQARLAFAAALLGVPLAEPAGAGTPIFVSPFGIPIVEGSMASPAFADLDGDGDLDAFVGNHAGNTTFFRNTGTASAPAFAVPSTDPFGLADVGYKASPDFADIDDDGDLDAFVGEGGGNTIFFANTGTASAPAFAAPATNPFGLADAGLYSSPAFADLDGDGDLDAFVGNGPGTNFFENTGTASAPAFAVPSSNPFGLADVGDEASPAFADIDDDGDLDAFVGEYYGFVNFFENTGTASAPAFAAPAIDPVRPVESRASPAFADIDGDGDLDAFVGTVYGTTILFENTGTASAPAFTGVNPFGFPSGFYWFEAWKSPAFADIDGDGDLDAFVGEYYGNTIFFANTGTASAPAFAPSGPVVITDIGYPAGVGFAASPTFADLDGDGDLDAFVGNKDGNTILFANTGTASAPAFAWPSTNPFGLADVGSYASPAFADIDGDGDLDAFVGNGDGNTIFFANTGTAGAPAFAASVANPFALAAVDYPASPAFADLDDDGDLDAFVGNWYGNTIFFENTGTASAPAFAASSANPFGLAGVGIHASPTFADIDGDGDLDAFVGSLRNTFYFENVEVGPGTCADGLDNDFDGRIDSPSDPGCADAADPNERSAQQCDNGLDDDGDGKIDWRGDGTGDPHCASLTDNNESPPPPPSWGCGIGPELLLLGPLLAAARRRPSSAAHRRRREPVHQD